MLKDLMILRHGQVDDQQKDRGKDMSRELSDQGKRNAQRMGVWIAGEHLVPEVILSSPASRAETTALKLCKSAGKSADLVDIDPRLYASGYDAVVDAIRSIPADVSRALVVGHNPSLSRLVGQLCRTGETGDKYAGSVKPRSLKPGALARLTIDCPWADVDTGVGACVQWVLPKDLPRKFPFPGVLSTEQRSRPAYYYRQSSVIPYRYRDGELEILIVSSSKKKHWVVPKGIHDPGKTAQESAAHEAWEEAGVEGEVVDAEVGVYQYAKWDATCTVTVFPMMVTRELPESQWQESHRGRRWVGVSAAAELVRNVDLKQIILALPAVLAELDRE